MARKSCPGGGGGLPNRLSPLVVPQLRHTPDLEVGGPHSLLQQQLLPVSPTVVRRSLLGCAEPRVRAASEAGAAVSSQLPHPASSLGAAVSSQLPHPALILQSNIEDLRQLSRFNRRSAANSVSFHHGVIDPLLLRSSPDLTGGFGPAEVLSSSNSSVKSQKWNTSNLLQHSSPDLLPGSAVQQLKSLSPHHQGPQTQHCSKPTAPAGSKYSEGAFTAVGGGYINIDEARQQMDKLLDRYPATRHLPSSVRASKYFSALSPSSGNNGGFQTESIGAAEQGYEEPGLPSPGRGNRIRGSTTTSNVSCCSAKNPHPQHQHDQLRPSRSSRAYDCGSGSGLSLLMSSWDRGVSTVELCSYLK
ncbi:hypothetical protein CEUSTIGMA_g11307.t1 [Chlamydomonas eustigma]|uniref:Uncharacterized protein n=1 Tax=Chlamydomonas eustigma TaxID=1157962 RepID=A0A250XLW2_9CHLO|nr:hypothetical protein CEUSTIGMA_g11307.t1 [Chlamydomonas eustigma]|eukprot:GAX83882.1 hypothetical protein CEUSTIGMA_g11307.t1 [Chlamydomonas eustigma]